MKTFLVKTGASAEWGTRHGTLRTGMFAGAIKEIALDRSVLLRDLTQSKPRRTGVGQTLGGMV